MASAVALAVGLAPVPAFAVRDGFEFMQLCRKSSLGCEYFMDGLYNGTVMHLREHVCMPDKDDAKAAARAFWAYMNGGRSAHVQPVSVLMSAALMDAFPCQ